MTQHRLVMWGLLISGVLMVLSGCGGTDSVADVELRRLLNDYGVRAIEPAPEYSAEQVALGEALFFDPELSGNRDTSCATCHHPAFATGDGLSLSIGTGGVGLGPTRVHDVRRELVPRNAPELFNRADSAWQTMFWDSRIQRVEGAMVIRSPAGADLPTGMDSLLAIQALFPITSRAEMRGDVGDHDVFGHRNDLADIGDDSFPLIWVAVMARITAIYEYREMLAAAYPGVDVDTMGFEYAAEAIGAYEATAFTFTESPFDRYLRGELDALTTEQKAGALLFYGELGCAECHSGPLLTDQKHHNLMTPQFGPGKERFQNPPFDFGRWRETRMEYDRWAFRTPPLRNVMLTGPWMHNGAYDSLADVIAQHLDPVRMYDSYDVTRLLPVYRAEFRSGPELRAALLKTLDARVATPRTIREADMAALLAFLEALTDPAAADLRYLVPARVPSGLLVETVERPGE